MAGRICWRDARPVGLPRLFRLVLAGRLCRFRPRARITIPAFAVAGIIGFAPLAPPCGGFVGRLPGVIQGAQALHIVRAIRCEVFCFTCVSREIKQGESRARLIGVAADELEIAVADGPG